MIQNSINLGSALGTTASQAILLANAAGVKLQDSMAKGSEAFKIALNQIINLEAGYKAMGATSGQVGNDMTAISIQAGLQATDVQKLTQAWDQYMGLLTGGTSGLSSFESALAGVTSGFGNAAGGASQANISVGRFAQDLTTFTGKGAQAWQNFNQVVTGGAQQFIDWMDNAAAVGVIKGGQMQSAIKGIVLQMLPLAAHSQAARAELAGLAQEAGGKDVTSMMGLRKWIGESGMSAKQLGDLVKNATVKLSDMGTVATNLGTVLQNQLTAAFDQAREKASGFNTDLSNLANDIANHVAPSSTRYQTDLGNLATTMSTKLGQQVPTITAFFHSMGVQITQSGVSALIAQGKLATVGSSAQTSGGKASVAAGQYQALANAINSLHSKSINIAINTSYTQEGAPGTGGTGFRNVPQHQWGGMVHQTGWALVGEQGPELRWLNAGDYISNASETRQFLASGHSTGSAGITAPAAAPAPPAQAVVHTTVNLDGQTIWQNQQMHTLRYGVRNGNRQSGAWAPPAGG
jgi:hypothetical protein